MVQNDRILMGKFFSKSYHRARVAAGYEVIPANIFIVDNDVIGQGQDAQDLFKELKIEQNVVNGNSSDLDTRKIWTVRSA